MTSSKVLLIIICGAVISLIGTACSDSSLAFDQGVAPGILAQAVPGDMITFDGHVFVASTRPETKLWRIAGWKISAQPFQGDEDSVPADCTLYPHLGVDDQWIGSCVGYTYIPRAGANHIAVMHTRPDGTVKLVQVAPPPVANNP